MKGQEFLKDIPEIWHKISGDVGYRTTSIIKKPYGFKISRFSNFISLQDIKYEIFEDGFSMATVKVDTNYRTPYQYKLYFDKDKKEIKHPSNEDSKELDTWKKLRNGK